MQVIQEWNSHSQHSCRYTPHSHLFTHSHTSLKDTGHHFLPEKTCFTLPAHTSLHLLLETKHPSMHSSHAATCFYSGMDIITPSSFSNLKHQREMNKIRGWSGGEGAKGKLHQERFLKTQNNNLMIMTCACKTIWEEFCNFATRSPTLLKPNNHHICVWHSRCTPHWRQD